MTFTIEINRAGDFETFSNIKYFKINATPVSRPTELELEDVNEQRFSLSVKGVDGITITPDF